MLIKAAQPGYLLLERVQRFCYFYPLQRLSRLQQTIFINTFSLWLAISCESFARQRIHMKHKPFFLRKIKIKKVKYRLLQFKVWNGLPVLSGYAITRNSMLSQFWQVDLSSLTIWMSLFLVIGVHVDCFHFNRILHRNFCKQAVMTLIRTGSALVA